MTPDKKRRLYGLVQRAVLRTIARLFGVESLSSAERRDIGEVQRAPILDRAFEVGARAASLGAEEHFAREAAATRIGTLITGLTDRATERYATAFDLQDVRATTAAAVEAREPPRTLASRLRDAS